MLKWRFIKRVLPQCIDKANFVQEKKRTKPAASGSQTVVMKPVLMCTDFTDTWPPSRDDSAPWKVAWHGDACRMTESSKIGQLNNKWTTTSETGLESGTLESGMGIEQKMSLLRLCTSISSIANQQLTLFVIKGLIRSMTSL